MLAGSPATISDEGRRRRSCGVTRRGGWAGVQRGALAHGVASPCTESSRARRRRCGRCRRRRFELSRWQRRCFATHSWRLIARAQWSGSNLSRRGRTAEGDCGVLLPRLRDAAAMAPRHVASALVAGRLGSARLGYGSGATGTRVGHAECVWRASRHESVAAARARVRGRARARVASPPSAHTCARRAAIAARQARGWKCACRAFALAASRVSAHTNRTLTEPVQDRHRGYACMSRPISDITMLSRSFRTRYRHDR